VANICAEEKCRVGRWIRPHDLLPGRPDQREPLSCKKEGCQSLEIAL